MARSLSVDLRRRVVGVIEGGLSCRAAAERFGLSASSAIRWRAQERREGDIRPKRQGGDRHSQRIEAHAELILSAVAAKSGLIPTALLSDSQSRSEVARRAAAMACSLHPDRQLVVNQVERFFADVTEKQIRRGVHRSTAELQTAIRASLDAVSADPKPFRWTKSADDILAAIKRFCLKTLDIAAAQAKVQTSEG